MDSLPRTLEEHGLYDLISEARQIVEAPSCARNGHSWIMAGGRACPRNDDDVGCSQAVYQCAHCGDYDYGYKGGPGYDDCYTHGPCSMECRP